MHWQTPALGAEQTAAAARRQQQFATMKPARGLTDEEQGLLAKLKEPATPPTPVVKPPGTLFGLPIVLVAGLSYCIASGSMVILNKHALNPKSFGFTAPNGKQYRLRPAEELATLIVRCGRGRGTAN